MEENKNESQRDASGEVTEINLMEVEGIANKYGVTTTQAIEIYRKIAGIARKHHSELTINALIAKSKVDTNFISDGYHTFGELYEHRIELFIALCKRNLDIVWKTHVHSDGTVWDGWFIMGLYEAQGLQISYHLPEKYWEACSFVRTLDIAPEFDGHTSEDVLKRLREL